jgi:hypothetical protein
MKKSKLMFVSFTLLLCASFAAKADTRTVIDNATVFDQLDAGVLDTSVTNLYGSAGALVTVVAALANSSSYCRIWESTGKFIGVYDGNFFKFMIVPGMDTIMRCPFTNGAVIKMRSMESAAITSGKIVVQFMR